SSLPAPVPGIITGFIVVVVAGAPAAPVGGVLAGARHAVFVPIGAPAPTQASSVAIDVVLSFVCALTGGIGICMLWMRSPTPWYTFFAAFDLSGACKSAYVTSGIGAPYKGCAAWHEVQVDPKIGCTSQKPVPVAAGPPT